MPGPRPRILGLAEAGSEIELSGVAWHMFDAIERLVGPVDRLDYRPGPVSRLAVAAATFRANRIDWRARFHTSLLAHRVLSAKLAARVRRHDAPFDVALQVFGWASNQPAPYALYVDQTRLMAERGWPSWMPITKRERAGILALEEEMYGGATHIFTMGRDARDSLIAEYGIDGAIVTVVGGGLNLGTMPPRRGVGPERTILFVGRDFERKGGDRLVEAFRRVRRRLPDARLDIVGADPGIRESGVVCHGEMNDRARLAHLFRSARVFCMPSRYEPWGLVFPEAMAHSIPCVGSTVESIPEILDHGRAGLLVSPDDVEALAGALLRLLSDDDLARDLGAAGRRHLEAAHTWDHVVERMAPVLRAIAAGH